MKFGSTGQEALTWAMNTYLPGMVCEKYSRSRIVAFSTGNVYGLTPLQRGGSIESDPLAPDYLHVPSGARVVHEEHGAISLPHGWYRVVRQREYTPASIRVVLD